MPNLNSPAIDKRDRSRRHGPFRVAISLGCAAFAAFAPFAGGASLYQIPWHTTDMNGVPIVPKTVVRAGETLPFRNEAVIRYLACGDEIRFLRALQAKKSDTEM